MLEELNFLWKEISHYIQCLPVEEINAKSRFSREAFLREHWIEKGSQVKELLNEHIAL